MAILQRITTASNSYQSNWFWASGNFTAKTVSVAADRYTVLSPAVMQVDVGGTSLTNPTQQTLDLSLDTNWDHGQSIGTWTANTAYTVGQLVRPTSAWLADGANNASVSYATSVMLSNTIPGPGVVSADSEYTGYKAFRGFNQDTTTSWGCATGAFPHWLKYSFNVGHAKTINKFRYYGNSGESPKRWKFQASNEASPSNSDNADWVTLLDNTGADIADPGSAWTSYFTFSNSTSYLHYRLYITTGYLSSNCTVIELHLVSTPTLVYRCTTAGTSHATTHPTMPITEGSTVTESGSTLQWTAYLDNTVASNRGGLDYYVYACTPTSGSVPKLLLSKQSTYPLGYTASNSRKIGGFHCLCEYIGANCYGTTAHGLYNYVKGDILPASVWDLRWKSNSLIGNVGQVYDAARQLWVPIYELSGTTSVPTVVYGGTILAGVNWLDSVDTSSILGMRLPRDAEFQSFAAGSNEGTVVYGAAVPTTCVGNVDTAGIRMISNIGVENCAGARWQHLDEQNYRFDTASSHTHSWTVDGNAQSNVVSGQASKDILPGGGWVTQSETKGGINTQLPYGSIKLCAGGSAVTTASSCGSRARDASTYQWKTTTGQLGEAIATRPVARHICKEFV